MSRMEVLAAGAMGTSAGAFIVQVLDTPLAPWWVFLGLGPTRIERTYCPCLDWKAAQ